MRFLLLVPVVASLLACGASRDTSDTERSTTGVAELQRRSEWLVTIAKADGSGYNAGWVQSVEGGHATADTVTEKYPTWTLRTGVESTAILHAVLGLEGPASSIVLRHVPNDSTVAQEYELVDVVVKHVTLPDIEQGPRVVPPPKFVRIELVPRSVVVHQGGYKVQLPDLQPLPIDGSHVDVQLDTLETGSVSNIGELDLAYAGNLDLTFQNATPASWTAWDAQPAKGSLTYFDTMGHAALTVMLSGVRPGVLGASSARVTVDSITF